MIKATIATAAIAAGMIMYSIGIVEFGVFRIIVSE